jgi:hypothetical protein
MAATVTIRLIDILGTAFSAPIVFTPKFTPLAFGQNMAIGAKILTSTDANGTGSVNLLAGQYQASVREESFTFTVPESTGTFELSSLID